MRLTEEFLINASSRIEQDNASVAALANGQFAVVWEGVETNVDYTEVIGQVFFADGSRDGDDFLVNEQTDEFQGYAQAEGLSGGGFAVIWATEDAPSYISPIVQARVFDKAGSAVSGEIALSSSPKDHAQVGSISAFDDNGFIVSYLNVSSFTGYPTGRFSQIFENDGTPDGPLIETSTLDGSSYASDSIILSDGSALIAWRVYDGSEPDGPYLVRGQIVDNAGALIGDEFLILPASRYDYADFDLAALPGNQFVITWSDESRRLDAASDRAVHAQILSDDGTPSGDAFVVNAVSGGFHAGPSVTPLDDGGFLVAWHDGRAWLWDIHARQFDAAGHPVGDETVLNTKVKGAQLSVDLDTLEDGRVVAAWSSLDINTDIAAVIIDPRTAAISLSGTEMDDDHVGTIYGDTLAGADGNDRLSGSAGTDHLAGYLGDDTLNGGSGDDELIGHQGNDILFGGSGNDRLVGLNGDDTLDGSLGNDDLSGGHGADRLDGGLGDDQLDGGHGPDVFVFGSGADRVLDWRNNHDTLAFEASLWGGAALTPEEVLDFADVVGGDIVFDFGAGHTLTVVGWTHLSALTDDIVVL